MLIVVESLYDVKWFETPIRVAQERPRFEQRTMPSIEEGLARTAGVAN